MGHGFDVVGVDGFELRDEAEDGGELLGVEGDVGVFEFEAGEFGDVADLGFVKRVGGEGWRRGGGGHGVDPSRARKKNETLMSLCFYVRLRKMVNGLRLIQAAAAGALVCL